MKRKHHFLALVLAIGMFFINTENVMAATGLSQAEELILERLKEGVEMNGIVVQPPASYLNQAENEFMKNEVDLTKEQAEEINHMIDEAAVLVKTMDINDLMNFKNSKLSKKLISLVEKAAAVADYSVSMDITNGTFNVLNSEGNYVFMAKDVINQTGFNMTATVMVGYFLLSLLIACYLVASKMKMFAKSLKA